MATDDTIYLTVKNTKTLLLSGLSVPDNNGNPVYQNAATLSGVLMDREENVILTLNLQYVPGSNGNYEADIGRTFDPVPGIYLLVLAENPTRNFLTLQSTSPFL